MNKDQITLTLDELVAQNNILSTEVDTLRMIVNEQEVEIRGYKGAIRGGGWGRFYHILETGKAVFSWAAILMIISLVVFCSRD